MRVESVKVDNKIWLSGWGDTEAKIMIITSHPTREDLEADGILAEGNIESNDYTARDELLNALNIVGFNLDTDFWITSAVKYGLGSKDKPTAQQIEECSGELDEEIATVKPKLIITLGAEAFKRIMKSNIKQSQYVGEIIDSPYGKVLVNYAPAQVFRIDPTLRPEFIVNFELAKRFIEDNLKYVEYEYIVVDNPKDNETLIQECINEELFSVGYDLEWKGKFLKDEKLYSFQYSVTPDRAIVLPLLSLDNPNDENLQLLNTMKPLLEHPKADRMGWNIRADDKRLVNKGFKLSDSTLGFDGMKAVALFDSRWGKGLEFGIKKFTNYKPYYNKFNEALRRHKLSNDVMSDLLFIEPDVFFEYAAGDAVSHREACLNMRLRMKSEVPSAVRQYYYEVYLPLTHYLMDMELTGIPINVECMTKLTKQYTQCYDQLYSDLMASTRSYGFDSEVYKRTVAEVGKENADALGLFEDFNPRSYIDKNKLFFDKLQLTPAYYVKKGKTKPKAWYDKQKPGIKAQYNPSANGKSMASIRFSLIEALENEPHNEELKKKYKLVKTYLDLARVSVFSHKFFSTQGVVLDQDMDDLLDEGESPLKSSYWAALSGDNRIHPDFYECLDNFRSSSRPNVQNPASKVLSHMPNIFEEFNFETPKNIRNIFYSGHKDWYFAEVDVAGADLAIAAFLSKDPAYIKDILAGGFHTTKMREYFKDPKLGKDDYSKYVTAKAITFRVAYTAGLRSAAMPIQAEIYAESGHYVDIKVIEFALDTWLRYDVYMKYRESCQNQVDIEGYIENLRGMRYYFERTDNPSIKAGWKNQSLAYPIASELALYLWDVCISTKRQFQKDKNWQKWIYPVNCVHDALYWIIHKDMLKDNYFPELCKHYFTKEVKIATGDNLGIEIVVGDCWKGKEKIFTKETKWNTQTKTWDWDK